MTLKEKSEKKAIEKESKARKEKLDKFFQSGFFQFITLFSSMFTFLFIGEYAKTKEINYMSAVILYMMVVLFISNFAVICSDKIYHLFHKLLQSTEIKEKSSNIPSFLLAIVGLAFIFVFVNPFTHWFMYTVSTVGITLFSWACVYQIFVFYAKKRTIRKKPVEIFSIQMQGFLLLIYVLYQLLQGIHFLGSTFFEWFSSFPEHISIFIQYFSDLTSLPRAFIYILLLLFSFISCAFVFIEEIILNHKTSIKFQRCFKIPFQKKNRVVFQFLTHTLHFSFLLMMSSCYSQAYEKLIYGIAPLGLFLVMALVMQQFWNKNISFIKKLKSVILQQKILAKKEFPFESNQYLQPVSEDILETFTKSNLFQMASNLESLFPDVEKNT